MATFRVIRAFSYVYEIDADSITDAEDRILDLDIEPVQIVGTDDIYTEELK